MAHSPVNELTKAARTDGHPGNTHKMGTDWMALEKKREGGGGREALASTLYE